MNEFEDYTINIRAKLSTIEDLELRSQIERLLDERDYLSQQASIDPLTGLNNRRILERIRDYSGVLMCDIDNFKQINDNYGHDVGDLAIKAVARILKANTRSNDYICRFGGDEFILIFTDCPEKVMDERAEKIAADVSKYIRISNNTDQKITLSVGLAMKGEYEKLEQTMKKADLALYDSKRNGKNRITKYEYIENYSIKK